jgi:hypothetical protein
MKVQELNREQLIELKQSFLCNKQESVSWGELADADDIVSDEELFEEYGHIEFTDEDFFCSVVEGDD